MLPLPWWILGVVPDEDAEEDSDHKTNDESHSATEECKDETAPTTPVSMFRTPSASPFIDVPDQLPKVVEFQTFLNIAKRRSSTKMETVKSKVRKTEKRNSLVRSETEIMNKSADGQSILGCDETFGIQFDTEPALNGSPMPFKDMFNKTFQVEGDDEGDVQCEERSSEESPSRSRDFPLFFTSFDDTTVLFNTTIAGDIDLGEKNNAGDIDLGEKNNAVGDWIFKSNDFLPKPDGPESSDLRASGDAVFKEPMQTTKRRGRQRATSVRSAKAASSRRAAPDAKEKQDEKIPEKKYNEEVSKKKQDEKVSEKKHQEKEEIKAEKGASTPNLRNAPSLTRRHTPSRKAKTYKSLREY